MVPKQTNATACTPLPSGVNVLDPLADESLSSAFPDKIDMEEGEKEGHNRGDEADGATDGACCDVV